MHYSPAIVARRIATALAAIAAAGSARAQGGGMRDDVARWMAQEPARFGRLLEAPERFRVQVLIGEVRGGRTSGRPQLVRHGYRVDAEYFYPASAVKLCAAAAALEKLGDLSAERGSAVGLETKLAFGPVSRAYPGGESDPRNPDGGRLTLDFLLRAALVASDNPAFNRLYDFVGRDELNQRMWRAGLASVRLRHRLDVELADEENRRTPAVELRPRASPPLRLPERDGGLALEAAPEPGLLVGHAHLEGARRVEGPKDFSGKNRVSLVDLQNLLAAALRPDLSAGAELQLTPDHRQALARALGGSAKDLGSAFAGQDFGEARFRPALQGVARALPRARIRAFGKSGLAYGFQVENAYFEDSKTGRALFLAAAIYADADGVVGDGSYDYDSVSRPFMADLGELAARRFLAASP